MVNVYDDNYPDDKFPLTAISQGRSLSLFEQIGQEIVELNRAMRGKPKSMFILDDDDPEEQEMVSDERELYLKADLCDTLVLFSLFGVFGVFMVVNSY